RTFLKAVVTTAVGASVRAREISAADLRPTLYNGIRLADPWPPRLRSLPELPIAPPYLVDPPAVIPIDLGRQLFVDDFLIEQTSLRRIFHKPSYHPASPVLQHDRPWEQRDANAAVQQTPPSPAAMVFSDGVFWDPE